jgi:hypothetical protein
MHAAYPHGNSIDHNLPIEDGPHAEMEEQVLTV